MKSTVLVCQRGARHRYAVPRLYEEAGMLEALYTDSSMYSGLGRMACLLERMGLTVPRMAALAARQPLGIPPEKVFSYDNVLGRWFETCLSRKYMRAGLRGANVIYSMSGEEFTFLRWAKAQGAKLVLDVFVHPGTMRRVEHETRACTGASGAEDACIEASENYFRHIFKLADIILCPSEWVAEGVQELAPEQAAKIRLVPYGSSLMIRDAITERPEVGRILFAGREPLRKGLHYLADAAALLKAGGIQVEVRVAGVSAEDVRWMKNGKELTCLGRLPLDRMHEEFEQADVFVLPSLSEGQAGVVLEAMACGCPVIATRESGVDFEPGCGITIPVCDAEALADAIAQVVEDRENRNALARGALRQAAAFSLEAWKARLVQVAKETVAV